MSFLKIAASVEISLSASSITVSFKLIGMFNDVVVLLFV